MIGLIGGTISDKIIIHYYNAKWKKVNIYYRADNAYWTKKPGLPMKSKGKGWWSIEIKASRLEFSFNNGLAFDNLGGTMGQYPQDPPENFRTSHSEVWIKDGIIYTANPAKSKPDDELLMLTLNLHAYQEFRAQNDTPEERIEKHEALFDKIAKAIETLDVDIICLQEVAEHSGNELTEPYGAAASNMAQRINLKIDGGKRYHLYQSWSHYAWDIWREGVAILSKFPIVKESSRYISISRNKTYFKSRKVVMTQIEVPHMGKINVFSVHTGWYNDKDDPFQTQFDNLKVWADEEYDEDVVGVFLCGDFNVASGEYGHSYIVDSGDYLDVYYIANPEGFRDPTIGGQIDGWEAGEPTGKRIDYIFMKNTSPFSVQLAQRIFTELSFGRVSDHNGLYASFLYARPKPQDLKTFAAGYGPYNKKIFLKGVFNGWKASNSFCFTYEGNNLYQLKTALELGGHEFKIADLDDSSVHFGGENASIVLDSVVPLTPDAESLRLDLPKAGYFIFTLDASKPTAPTLHIAKAAHTGYYRNHLYLKGSFNDFIESDAYMFKFIGANTFDSKDILTVTTSLAAGEHNFIIADAANSKKTVFGASPQDAQLTFGQPKTLIQAETDQVLTLSIKKHSTYKFLLDADLPQTPTLTIYDIGPYGATLYLRGVKGWDYSDSVAFIYQAETDSFALKIYLEQGDYQFKIADATWRGEINFGARDMGQTIRLGESMTLSSEARWVAHNISLTIEETGDYLFNLLIESATTPALTVAHWSE
jgi:endonuclease/exonuclease/phosphatase family metal-dependent hydrolase